MASKQPLENDAATSQREQAKSIPKTQDRAERLSLKGLQGLPSQERSWLIDRFLVARQPMLVGGAYKSLKTSLVLDLAISLAAQKPFLGSDSLFSAPEREYRVAIFSGESGEDTLFETAARISEAKGLPEVPANILLCTSLPHFNDRDQADLTVVQSELRHHQTDVVFFDPVYLCMPGINAASVFEVGHCLQKVASYCLDVGCTPVLIHHTKKGSRPGRAPLQLSDLVAAGFAEFARQWFLIRRKTVFSYGETAKHELVVAYGGSAGHYGVLDISVDEGGLVSSAAGRAAARRERWDVTVRRRDEPGTAEVSAPKKTRGRIKDEADANHKRILEAVRERLRDVAVDQAIGIRKLRTDLKNKGFKGVDSDKKMKEVAADLEKSKEARFFDPADPKSGTGNWTFKALIRLK